MEANGVAKIKGEVEGEKRYLTVLCGVYAINAVASLAGGFAIGYAGAPGGAAANAVTPIIIGSTVAGPTIDGLTAALLKEPDGERAGILDGLICGWIGVSIDTVLLLIGLGVGSAYKAIEPMLAH